MKPRTRMPKPRYASAKDSFWGAVVDCLVDFHHMPHPDAVAKRDDLRNKLDNPPPGLMDYLYLHEEPFYIACNLAGTTLALDPVFAQYEQILQRHNW